MIKCLAEKSLEIFVIKTFNYFKYFSSCQENEICIEMINKEIEIVD